MTTLHGPVLREDGVLFRLWAPTAQRIRLLLHRPFDMISDAGWHHVFVPGAGAGDTYRFEVDGDLAIPDPASRFQPDDVHGPSEVIDQTYRWRNPEWKGRPFAEAVFYELHVGTFTAAGTYRAAIDKLDHLAEMGITAIELMPVADFPGRWNWGYDGVLLFAPDSVYGRPEDLKALIDAAHGKGLMVFLDVVYNHFGPDGNYLHRLATEAFSQAQTPWGGAVNYSNPPMRAFVLENALQWLRDYRFDGLRLDAVHAIITPGEPHLLRDLSQAVGELADASGRHIHLVLENDDNIAAWLEPLAPIHKGKYRAQWNDDYHHAWHVLLSGESHGYYKDYSDPGPLIAWSLAEGFVYQGHPSRHRKNAPRGEPSAQLSPLAFVNFLQNHDQIGNRALGERLSVLAEPERLRAAYAILLLAPSPPLIFMGDEWGAKEPFPFFCDFTGDLADAVRNGRKKEFAEAYADPAAGIPDPLSANTVRSAILDWSALLGRAQQDRLRLMRELLRLRQAHIVPFITPAKSLDADAQYAHGVMRANWRTDAAELMLVANLSDEPAARPDVIRDWDAPIWGGAPPAVLAPWSVFFQLAHA